MPLSIIFRFCHGGQFCCWRKLWVRGENQRPASSHRQTLLETVLSSTSPWAGINITILALIGIDYIEVNQATVRHLCSKYIQWSLFKPNVLGNNLCVRSRQVFSLYRFKLTKIIIGTLLNVWFTQDLSLSNVWFRQIWLYIYLMSDIDRFYCIFI
jgi:hypothetical protein